MLKNSKEQITFPAKSCDISTITRHVKVMCQMSPKQWVYRDIFVEKFFDNAYKIVLELRPEEVKVTVTPKHNVTLRDLKMYPHTKVGIRTSNTIGDIFRT